MMPVPISMEHRHRISSSCPLSSPSTVKPGSSSDELNELLAYSTCFVGAMIWYHWECVATAPQLEDVEWDLAVEVGYGKTMITLGLIDSTPPRKEDAPPPSLAHCRIPVGGTLVVVPPHLTRQWASEVEKFCGNKFNICIISMAANLNSLTIKEIQDADIVVVASNLFKSSVYLTNLEAFSAAGTLPAQEGRYFNARLKQTLLALGEQVELLKDKGAVAVTAKIKEAELKMDEPSEEFVPSKCLKGKQYRNANTLESTHDKKSKVPTPQDQSSCSGGTPTPDLIVEVVVNPLSNRHQFKSSPSVNVDSSSLPSMNVNKSLSPVNVNSDDDSEREVIPMRSVGTSWAAAGTTCARTCLWCPRITLASSGRQTLRPRSEHQTLP